MITLFFGYLHSKGYKSDEVLDMWHRWSHHEETFDDIFVMQDFCSCEKLSEADIIYQLRG